jgi:hypothetical protein
MLIALELVLASRALPQQKLSIGGRITSVDGRVIVGATVYLRDLASDEKWTFITGSDGAYEIKGFRPGVYQLTVEASGFQKYSVDPLRLADVSTHHDAKLAPVANRFFPWPQQADFYIAAANKVLPALGPGLRAFVRNAKGNYYALVEGKHVIEEYALNGTTVSQIPATPTPESAIVYGVALTVDQSGRIYVADQGSNSVKIYNADGKLLSVVKTNAPVSVQGVQEGEIAVQQLGSSHLVTVLDRRGEEVRQFIEMPRESERRSGKLAQRWRFYPDARGNIFCTLPSVGDWTIRKFDPYGIARYDITIPSDEFGPESRLKKVMVLLTPSMGLPGIGMMGGGMGLGPAGPKMSPMGSSANINTEPPPSPTTRFPDSTLPTSTPPNRGTTPDPEASGEQAVVDTATQAKEKQLGEPDARAALQSPVVTPTSQTPKPVKNKPGEVVVSDDPDSNSSVAISTEGIGRPAMGPMPGGPSGASGQMGGMAPMAGGAMGMMGAMSGGMPVMMSSAVQWIRGGLGGGLGDAAGPRGPGSGTSGGPPKGGFGMKSTIGMAVDVTIRPGIGGPEMVPDVDAIGVDPETAETWVAIGGKLLHFDKEGNRMGTYSFATTGAPVRPVSLIVETTRILVATDPYGVYVYPRPDIVPMLPIRPGQQPQTP